MGRPGSKPRTHSECMTFSHCACMHQGMNGGQAVYCTQQHLIRLVLHLTRPANVMRPLARKQYHVGAWSFAPHASCSW